MKKYKKIKILKSDNLNTRHAKKSQNLRKKRCKKLYTEYYNFTEKKVDDENTYNNSKIIYDYEIENFCRINNIHKWKSTKSIIKFENSFCLFENPNLVLRRLLEMLHRAKTNNDSVTFLKYEGHVSFGALYLIDNLLWQISKRKIWRFRFKNISLTEKEKISKLKSFENSSYDNVNATMINNQVYINRSSDPMARQSYLEKSKEITDLLQKAIQDKNNDPNFELNHETHQAISSTIGELFDNIVLHSRETKIGILCAFYDKENKEITILIYNFGKTISETMEENLLPEEMQLQIDEIIENHKKNNFFSFESLFTKENAVTLLSIQEGISSVLDSDPTRGHGLTDFIEHCFTLSQDTRIVIISGKTALKIDKKYQFDTKNMFGRERRILALNSQNDLYNKPDSDYLLNLNVKFPGVLIETTIPLNV